MATLDHWNIYVSEWSSARTSACCAEGLGLLEFHETCHSVTFYFMKKYFK